MYGITEAAFMNLKKVTEAGFGMMPICHIGCGHTSASWKICFYL